MAWDRKQRGPKAGYFYRSVRVPDRPHPVKIYCGRMAAGHLAAAEVEERRLERRAARDAVRTEQKSIAEADRLAQELRERASLLAAAWLVATGHRRHHGIWRFRNGKRR